MRRPVGFRIDDVVLLAVGRDELCGDLAAEVRVVVVVGRVLLVVVRLVLGLLLVVDFVRAERVRDVPDLPALVVFNFIEPARAEPLLLPPELFLAAELRAVVFFAVDLLPPVVFFFDAEAAGLRAVDLLFEAEVDFLAVLFDEDLRATPEEAFLAPVELFFLLALEREPDVLALFFAPLLDLEDEPELFFEPVVVLRELDLREPMDFLVVAMRIFPPNFGIYLHRQKLAILVPSICVLS